MINILPDLPQGPLAVGEGRISAYLCFTLGGLSLLGVLAFMFPSYLTTPDLRATYDPARMRGLMTIGLIAAAGFGAYALSRQAERRFASAGLVFSALAMLLGGPDVAQGVVEPGALYIGVDWFILGLISTGGTFIMLEKLAPLRPDQPVLRDNWLLDMKYFLLFHLMIGFFPVRGELCRAQMVCLVHCSWTGQRCAVSTVSGAVLLDHPGNRFFAVLDSPDVS